MLLKNGSEGLQRKEKAPPGLPGGASISFIRGAEVSETGFAEFFFELRHCLEKVCHEAVISDLEDRCFFVLVDGNDDLGVLHARKMLDGTGYADSDVKLGSDNLAGLADLVIVRHEARIDGCARGTHSGTELVSDLFQHGEVFAILHAVAARDDDLGGGESRTVGLGELF